MALGAAEAGEVSASEGSGANGITKGQRGRERGSGAVKESERWCVGAGAVREPRPQGDSDSKGPERPQGAWLGRQRVRGRDHGPGGSSRSLPQFQGAGG